MEELESKPKIKCDDNEQYSRNGAYVFLALISIAMKIMMS